ncbi:MAG: SRPBCC domain-containing protein [Acidobacteriota bacterium]|nr:SRPBCC domain-containing protein [Acidobacteriota bacterium]
MPALESVPAKTGIPTFMLTQTRVIRAPRARVYEAWTTPEILQKWFGPEGRHSPSASMDVRVGGAYRIEFAMDNQPPAAEGEGCKPNTAAFGEYTKIVPNELLQFTWASNWQPEEQSLVTISLKDVDGGSEITILHENFNTEASRDGHNLGWAGSLVKLAAMLEG